MISNKLKIYAFAFSILFLNIASAQVKNDVFQLEVDADSIEVGKLYETSISHISDFVHLKGNVDGAVFFWLDKAGYNYVIRSKKGSGSGIYLYHWVIQSNKDSEQIDFYKNELECGPKLRRIQRHIEGVALHDADNDGYFELYTLVFDDCVKEDEDVVYAELHCFSKPLKNCIIKGTSYGENSGGEIEISKNLQVKAQLQEKAKDLWEIFILN